MQNTIEQVAAGKFLDPDQLKAFAVQNRDRYGVNGSDEYPSISTWYVNELVAAFRESLGDDFEAHRQEQIDKIRGRLSR